MGTLTKMTLGVGINQGDIKWVVTLKGRVGKIPPLFAPSLIFNISPTDTVKFCNHSGSKDNIFLQPYVMLLIWFPLAHLACRLNFILTSLTLGFPEVCWSLSLAKIELYVPTIGQWCV